MERVLHLNFLCTLYAENGASLDYNLLFPPQVGFLHNPPTTGNARIHFRLDRVAQEPNETLTLRLIPIVPIPTGDAVFFRDTLAVTLVDSDSE